MPDRLVELAADARVLIDTRRASVQAGWVPEAHTAVRALLEHVATLVPRDVAERAVDGFILLRRPIRECLEQARKHGPDEFWDPPRRIVPITAR